MSKVLWSISVLNLFANDNSHHSFSLSLSDTIALAASFVSNPTRGNNPAADRTTDTRIFSHKLRFATSTASTG